MLLATRPVIRVPLGCDQTAMRMVATGELVRLFPGVLTVAARRDDLAVRVAAVRVWRPHAVVTGMAAARLSWWPGEYAGPVDVLMARPPAYRARGYAFHRVVPDPGWISERDGIRFTNHASTAMWLAGHDDGAAIDNGLRLGAFRLDHLGPALDALGRCRGNTRRRQVLRESRDEPWSYPERKAHRVLRRHRVTGWQANYRVVIKGSVYYADLAFPAEKVVVEIDGYAYHRSRQDRQRDSRRHNAFIAEGWRVLHVTPDDVDDEAYLLGVIAQCRMERRLPVR